MDGDKIRRILAWVAIAVLLSLYIFTIGVAIFTDGNVAEYVLMCVMATAVVAGIAWGLHVYSNVTSNNKAEEIKRTMEFRKEMEKQKNEMLEKQAAEAAEGTAEAGSSVAAEGTAETDSETTAE